ncbi:hypothetical protein MJH54_28150, partial [Salmonella enterica subsp. enterica serovar Montevideo]|nr:hypothetical protein [Salmonella enterica subsp. enterica serovar Montevideo]
IDSGNIPPQYTESQLAQLVFNNRLDAGLTIFFMVVVVVLAVFIIKTALDFEFDPKDNLFVRIDRRRKLPATIILRALNYTTEQILDLFF